MSDLYRFLTTLVEPLVLVTARAIEPADESLRRDRCGELASVPGGLWLHAASAGEVRGLVPLARSLDAEVRFIMTAHTAAGVAAAGSLLAGLPIHRMPFDLPRVMRRAFDRSRVAAVVLAETELWPNMLDEARRRAIPVALVNARISNRSWPRYRASRGFWRTRLIGLHAVAAQSEVDAERFRHLGVPAKAIQVTGNMKHDRQHETITPAGHPWGEAPVVVLGSVRPGEETMLAVAMKALTLSVPDLRIVVAPRHRSADDRVERAFRQAGFSVSRRSRGGPEAVVPVLLLDTMGELNSFYAVARVACVGGTFCNYGGHNVAEPALAGTPVIFGSFTDNCRLEADVLRATGAGIQANSGDELIRALREQLLCERGSAADRCRRALSMLAGATARTREFLVRREFPGFRQGMAG